MSNTPNYEVDYNDERFDNVESEKNQAKANSNAVYDGMINSSDKYFNDLIQETKNYGETQKQVQQEQTDFAFEKIEQQKEQANKDYIKEQSGAYVDWQKQSSKHGVEAEKMASAGLTNTGYSESSQVSMYNTYQNRVATAREVYNRAVLNYDNAIKDAQLQNNAALAEIAYNTLTKTLELSLQGFQYKNQLITDKLNKELEIDNIYYNRYQDVLQQINTENALAEDIRQYNETMKWNTEQAELDRQFEADQARLEREFKAAEAELDRTHEEDMLKAKTAAEKAILAEEHRLALEKLTKEREEQEKLLKYEYNLKSTPITGNSATSSNNSAKTSLRAATSVDVKNAMMSPQKRATTTANMTVNPVSKLSLGEGPMSDADAADRVNNGTATAYIRNGQIYVTPTASLPTMKWKSDLPPITQPKTTTTTKTNTKTNTKKTQPYRFRGL